MNVATYTRVSTRDRQDPENQAAKLRRFADANGWQIAAAFEDRISGATAADDCPGLSALMTAASRREFDAVLVWSLDRFSRRSISATFELIGRLESHGVQFVSFTEEHFRTTGPAGKLLLAISAWIAEEERRRLSERVKAGIDRARAQGKPHGRRALTFDVEEARRRLGAGEKAADVAAALGISRSLLFEKLKEPAE